MPPLSPFHPIVRKWFRETLGEPSPPQRAGWPAIAGGGNVLILAPTGTGKTLTAFLWELNALIVEGLKEPLPNAVQILYVSPLKALGNDIQRNLESPLAALKDRFEVAAKKFPEIRVAVRTGDTPSSARQRMLRKSPHVLITTPESLHIMLTSVRGRGMFSGVRAVIVDEIHALAGTKRGAHLALTLERLEELCDHSPQRIGLSATQRPLEEIARFLGGLEGGSAVHGLGSRDSGDDSDAADARPRTANPAFRPVTIVDCGLVKPIELAVQSPVEDLGHPEGGTIWPSVAPLVVRHVRAARTTLVFVNNRAQAERMAARINALAGEELALPYHGSLSRDRRLQLEGSLKAGRLRALVTTSALEMGIDIGSVDLVLQLQSPKRVSTALQRVGRAGHTLTATSRGVLVPTFRDDGMEMLAIVRGMRAGDVEPTRVVQNALDVLAQVIVAAVAIDDDWTSERLFAVVRRSYPYHALTRTAFDEVLSMLAGKYPADVAAELEARIVWDRATDTLSAARSARMVAVISGGTIPDRGYYTVNLPDRTRIGELDEEFVHETRIGDVFQLGSSTWRVNAIEHDRVIVTPAPGAPARMPFWHGELAARSAHLAPRVGELRRQLDAARTIDDLETLAREYDSDHETVRSLAEYVHEQRASTRVVPDDRTVLAEQFRDETGAVRLVIHAPFGARVTAPWGMALAQRYREWFARTDPAAREPAARSARDGHMDRVTVEVQTTDDGVMLRLPQLAGDAPLDPLRGLTPEEAERRVLEEVGQSSLFGARFRMNAARALLLPRGSPRRRMPLWLQRLKAQDLLQAVREFPSFPIVVETYRDVLQDAFDMRALGDVLRGLETGSIALRSVKTELPSPFAASLQFGFVMDWMYADDTPRAERRAAILSLDRALLDELMSGAGADEPTLEIVDELAAARRGTTPGRRARSADELAILLDRAGDLSLEELEERIARGDERLIGEPIVELLERGRAMAIDIPAAGGAASRRVILTESFPRYAAAFGVDAFARVGAGRDLAPTPLADAVPAALREPSLSPPAARRELLARWVALAGVFGVDDVLRRYDFDREWVEARLTEWTRTGRLVRGAFGRADAVRFVSRRLLEEARRRELARLRRQVEAVDMAAYVRFLQRWQHLDPETRLVGSEGAAATLRQLYGLARPADGWDRDYFPARIEGYAPELVSRLAAAGEATWIGGTNARDDGGEPPSLTTVRFVRRAGARAWLPAPPDEARLGEDARKTLGALAYAGASFFDELVPDTGLSTRRLRDALRELAAMGLVTNDTMEGLRAVTRWRALPRRGSDAPDPTRWLPADFTPSANRPVVQRRPNLRRLPKWRPPQAGESDTTAWPGRWALVRTPRILGPEQDETAMAEAVARQMLARYGVVARDWWRRERPAVSWGAIYRELRRLEYRGEIRRGYFVRGLAGAQFALPEAIEELRAAPSASPPPIGMSASDPANAYALPLAGEVERDALTVGLTAGAIIVTIAGVPILASDGRARRVRVRAGASEAQITDAARALVQRVVARHAKRRDVIVELIDGDRAATSPHAAAFLAAGFRLTTAGLRWYAH